MPREAEGEESRGDRVPRRRGCADRTGSLGGWNVPAVWVRGGGCSIPESR